MNPPAVSAEFQENIARIEELTGRMLAALSRKKEIRSSLQGPGPEFMGRAIGAYWAEMLHNPDKVWSQQLEFWSKTLQHAAEAQQALLTPQDGLVPEDNSPRDRRFSNPLWDTHPYFNYLKQQYFISAEAVKRAVEGLEESDPYEKERMRYFARQIVDMMAPTNFFATNPDALEKAIKTEGRSLVDGLENMIRDLEKNNGELLVTLSDPDAFTVGKNLGTAEGGVVFRNRMFELIQYKAQTEEVYEKPLVIFPPWINKFYILDLKEQNSLIRWIVAQGYTLYVVSWVNPDPSYADVGMDQYVEEGYLTAIEQVKQMTGQESINVVGYCIAGTVLALTLSLMKARGDASVASATFFTTLTDFSDQGEVGVFLDDDFIDGIEEEAAETGLMSSIFMSRTFSYLRANDLIYTPAIRSYMLGDPPPAFDLLYWNGDGTNLPGKMAVDYLRSMCQADLFAGEGEGVPLLGEKVKVGDVDVPLCAVACETDHIAAWPASYRGVRKMGSQDKTFILSESGHIAGIVNPPSKKKYGHYTNTGWPESAKAWQAEAEFHPGSWWGRWEAWLAPRSGKRIPARDLGDSGHPVLAPAPGTYVTAVPKA